MKVSIVTICFNSEKTIRCAIESVLGQTYDDIEYIIIDGDSKDSTMEIVNEYSSMIYKVVSEPDNGIYDAMSKGILLATGEVVGVLNSDDFFYSKEVISQVVDFFKVNDVDAIFGGVTFVSPENVSKPVRHYGSHGFKRWMLRFGLMPPHPASFIKRSVYEKSGLYSSKYKISGDFEFFVRAFFKESASYNIISSTLVTMRTGGVSTSGFKSIVTSNKEMVHACLINDVYSNLFFVSIRLPFKFFQLFIRNKV